MTRIRLGRIFWIGAAAVLVAAALVALGGVLRGDFSETDGRILVTLAAVLYAGGTALAGLALAERGPARGLGRVVAGAAPIGLVLVLWAIWDFIDEGDNQPQLKLAWTAVLALLAGLIATTALLFVRRRPFVTLAGAAGALAGVAATLSVAGIWSGDSNDAFLKLLAAVWILAALCYFLIPVLQRFASAEHAPGDERVLASLDEIELVATRTGGIEVGLEPGERLLLRRR